MRIIDVYGSNNGIVLVETSNKLYGIEVETIHRKFTGQNANIYLERLSRLIPEKIYDNGTDAKLNFNKPIVLILHDYKNINLKDIKPIAELLKSKNISLKFHNYKLQKSNNFYGKILIPMTLVTIISLSTPYIVKQIIKKKDKNLE